MINKLRDRIERAEKCSSVHCSFLRVVMQIQNVITGVFSSCLAFCFGIIRHECFHVVHELLARDFSKRHPVEDIVQLTVELIGEFQDFVCLLEFFGCGCGVLDPDFLIASGQCCCKAYYCTPL